MPETNFFWDPLSDNILQERDGSGAVTAEYTTEPGLYGNLISQNRIGLESQYHFDAQGSTLALTDDIQQVTDTNAYSAFGEVAEHTGCTVNPFQFVGHSEYCRDAQTSNYSVRNRVLSPGLTRWLTLPPLTAIWTSQEAVDQREIEQYRYASSAPTTLIDPSGLPNPPPRPKPPSDPKPGQCLVMFECANVAIFGYHCGIAIKWWNGGTLQTRTYHAHGLYARVLGCKLERADGLRPHPYGLQNIDYHSEAVCTCIRNAVDTFNEGITRAGASYMLDPFNACGGGPHCNSNYATKCVLRACGLSPPKPETIFYVAGWDFRMYICMESSPRTHCRCVCERWKRLDDTWCGGPPSTATHAD